jgi:hypothetical protein
MTSDRQREPQKTEHQESKATENQRPTPPPIRAELERKRFRIDVATLIVIIFYTTFAGYQSFKMREATEATKKSADAAEVAAKISKDMFDFNKDALHVEIQKQTRAMQDSADSMKETVKQGNAALNDTIKNFRVEHRAWVGTMQAVTAAYMEGGKNRYVKEGQPPKCGVIIINSGKTPARKLRGVVSLITLKAGEELTPKFEIDNNTAIPHSNLVMQPGTQLMLLSSLNSLYVKLPGVLVETSDDSMVSTGDVSVKPFSKADIDDLAAGKKVLYMFGLITYEDIFNQSHWTKFCMYLSADLSTFTGCSKYNETDN